MAKTGKNESENKQDLDMRLLVADIMTRNVNLSKEEYRDVLIKIGVPEQELDKCTEEERAARIKSNYYGTMLNMNLSIYNALNQLRDENETMRAVLSAICKALGIDVEDIKSSTDKVNEAAAEYLKKQTELVKKQKFVTKK